MDAKNKVDLITRNAVEIITREDAEEIFSTNPSPKGYLGFEPSGQFHVGWMIWVNAFKDMMNAGIKMTLLEATWHAWINNKLGGDMRKIQLCATYIEHCLTALGVDLSKVELVKADNLVDGKEYWDGLIRINKQLSLSRVKRAVTIMGRKEDEASLDFSMLLYPSMQVEDIFFMGMDFALGGMDQRRAHVLAREVAPALGKRKPVAVHTPLLSGLQGSGRMDTSLKGADSEAALIEGKMSKSKPESCIFVHDSPAEIKAKIAASFCPPKIIEGNPVMEIAKYILMRDKPLHISRPAKYGGDIEFATADELMGTYSEGKIHPLDLKNAVSEALAERLAPVREYFAKFPEASDSLREFRSPQKV
uniref:tyrosine--tRNA ligase n=1 Tax=Candidatus Methanomethylicus mesodigestus TaxID=1867258 RepID=A0A7C3IM73_9CREN